MSTYHATSIGYRQGAVRLERLVEAKDARDAAQQALWLAETMGVSVNSVLVREKQDKGWGPLKAFARGDAFARDDLRAPFYGADIARPGATINARHLPPEERTDLTRLVQTGGIAGLVGEGRVAVLTTSLDPMEIEDTLPIMSSLVQIATDEGIEWLVLDVAGPFLEEASTYPDE